LENEAIVSGGKLAREGLSAQSRGAGPAALFFGSIARHAASSRALYQVQPADLDRLRRGLRHVSGAHRHTERTVECPHCQLTQVWTLDDIDRSVFKK